MECHPYQRWGYSTSQILVPNTIGYLRALRETLDLKIVNLTEKYNVAICRSLSSQLHVKLPRELRDMVYEQLVGTNVTVNNMSTGDKPSRNSWGSSHYGRYIFARDDKELPYFASDPRTASDQLCHGHHWDKRITGQTFAHGLAYAWYKCNEFIIPSWNRDATLNFLDMDRFLGGQDPKSLIRQITKEIAVCEDIYIFGSFADWCRRTKASIDALVARGACGQMRIHIQFILEMRCRHHDQILFLTIIRELFPAIVRLRRAGLNVEVTAEDLHGPRRSPQSTKEMQDAMREWTEILDRDVKVSRNSE